ncbi:MAG: beta-lactamase family protein [Winogradskyella sp.]|nr:beta-lactamase family protein [Winogradskyella sp.]
MSLIFVALIIYLLWRIESHIPSFFNILNRNNGNINLSVNKWLTLLVKKKKFNGVVYINTIDNGEIIIKNKFRTFEEKDLIDEDTSFRLASVSKQFTAFAIMLLHKEKKIHYDSKINLLIKDFPSSKVTIRHLLNQTSGITVDYISLAKKYKKQENYILSISDATELICKHTDKNIVPLVFFQYNNSNYIILARIIELISELSFEDFMKKNLFDKLNLNKTFVWNLLSTEDIHLKDNVATGFEAYLKSKPIDIKPSWIDGVAGDGAIFSSLNDLKKWLLFWEGNELLNHKEIKEAFKKPILVDGSESNYGFGWVIEDNHIWHNGKWLASNSLIIKSLTDNKSLISLDNSTNIRFNKITKILTQIIFLK